MERGTEGTSGNRRVVAGPREPAGGRWFPRSAPIAVSLRRSAPIAIRLRRSGPIAISLLLVAAAIPGCRFFSTNISRIREAPYRFQGREVTVSGRVEAVRWIPDVGAIGFRLVDGSDSLLVLTHARPPAAHRRARIHGRISRRFPIDGSDRIVLFYRVDGADGKPSGRADPR